MGAPRSLFISLSTIGAIAAASGAETCVGPPLLSFSNVGSSPGDAIGTSVALRGDLLLAGAPLSNYNSIDGGAVLMYTHATGNWMMISQLAALDTLPGDAFGAAVAIVDPGLIAVGAPGHDEPALDAGSVELFVPGTVVWQHAGSISPATTGAGGRFGSVLACDGTLLASTASLSVDAGAGTIGTVELWRRRGETGVAWTFEAALTAGDGCGDCGFGASLAIAGDRLFVGAPADGLAGRRAGAVHVFERLAGTWTRTATIVSSSPAPDAEFGAAVSFRDGLLAIGAPGVGAVSLLVPPVGPVGAPWTQVGSIVAPPATQRFGHSVAIAEGWRIVVGAPSSPASKRLWRCHLLDFNWVALESSSPALGAPPNQEQLGASVASDGPFIAVGAPQGGSWEIGSSGMVLRSPVDPSDDCDGDGIGDECEIELGLVLDMNGNGVPDGCDDCNGNDIADQLDLAAGTSADCNANLQPDECEIAMNPSADCDLSGVLDACELEAGVVTDCNNNGKPDSCDLAANPGLDCDGNGILDACDISLNRQTDCDHSGVPDACELALDPTLDCDGDGQFDACQISAGLLADCDGDGVPDQCRIDAGVLLDCNGDGVPNRCETTYFLDDGKGAATIGLVDPNTDFLWLNGFRVSHDSETIAALAVAWTTYGTTPEDLPPAGTPAKVALYVDPDDDGDPRNATLVAVVETTFEHTPKDRFTIFPIAPVVVGDADEVFYVAAYVVDTPGLTYPAAADIDVHVPLKRWFAIWPAGTADLSSLANAFESSYMQLAFMVRAITLDGVMLAADLDCDGTVGSSDLGIMLAAWGACPSPGTCPADVTQDGIVDGADLAWLLSTW